MPYRVIVHCLSWYNNWPCLKRDHYIEIYADILRDEII